eukprot:450486-Heterocapsa_arctica.AAC.1
MLVFPSVTDLTRVLIKQTSGMTNLPLFTSGRAGRSGPSPMACTHCPRSVNATHAQARAMALGWAGLLGRRGP